MREVHNEKGYLFYIGKERMKGGCSRDLWNIIPEPKTTKEKLSFKPPETGYPNRRWIEKVKGIKFPDRYQPTLNKTTEVYISDEWNGIE